MKNTSKKAKRVLAMFLAMMMCLSMLNLTAFAEESAGGNTAASEPAQAATDGAPSTAVTDTPVTNETPATQPTEAPKPAETAAPTAAPTAEGTAAPAPSASAAPSAAATETPAGEPTLAPSAQPTQQPADEGSDDAPNGAAPDAGTPGADEEKPAEHEHTWENGKCTTEGCGAVCEHKEHTPEGKCTVCEAECEHQYNTDEPDGKCTVCGAECEHQYNTEEPDGKCTVCGAECEHKYKTEEPDGKCTVCGAECEHEFDKETGICKKCNLLNPEAEKIDVANADEFVKALSAESKAKVINLTAEISLSKELTIDKSVTIRGAKLSCYGYLSVTNGAKVTLENFWGVRITTTGSALTIGKQVTITTLIVTDGGTLNMEEGAHADNVTVDKSSNFTMNGGTIESTVSMAVYVINNSTFVMNNGTIAGGNECVNLGFSSTFDMKGGTIKAAKVSGVDISGEFRMSGGCIESCLGPGVMARSKSTITISGGTITNNVGGINANGATVQVSSGKISDNTATYGGGIYANCSTVAISGAEITDNKATYGGGIYVAGSTLTVSGGTISYNAATTKQGGGIYAQSGSFAMSGGSIIYNEATGYGGGIYCSNVTPNMSGGSITANTCGSYGGGVYCYKGNLSVSGDVAITGNTKNGVPHNVYVGNEIYVTGAMGANANVGFTVSAPAAGKRFAKGKDYTLAAEDAKKFTLDVVDTDLEPGVGEGNILVLKTRAIEPSEAKYEKDGEEVIVSLQTALIEVPVGGTVTLITDVTSAADINVPHDVTLDLAGHTLNLNGHHIVVPSGMSFTLDCPNGGMITGGGDSSTNGGAVEVNGAFIMNSGTLCGNTGLYGGAVYVASGGQFTMNGGTINGNTASNGGGIFVQTGAVAYVNAGKITNNTATCKAEEDESLYPYGGGGIYVNGGKSGKENGKLYLKNVAVTANEAGSGTADRPQFNAGAGLSACPTSNTKIYITSGGVIAGNLPGINGKPISQVFVDEGNDNSKHEVFLSKYALGGGVYNWTDAEGKPLVGAGEEVNLTNGGKVNAFSDLKVNLDVLGGIASVIISGNTSAYSGGGIGSNGDVIIGEDKAVLPIRKVVDGEGTPAQTEFKFDVTLTQNGSPYAGSVVLNGAEMNGDKSGKFTLTLKAGETKVLTNMDAGVAYTITEQPSGASSVTVNNEKSNTISGTTQLESAGVAEIVFTNTYDASTPTPPPTNPPVVVIPTPTPTPTATPTPTPEPTEEPTPTPEPDEEIPDEDVPLGTPKPEPTPEPDEEIPDEDVPLGTPKPEPTPEPDEEIPDPDVPLGPSEPEPTPEPEEEIPDEDVPLANTPKTGDNADIWFLLSVISAAGLVFLGAAEWKKRKGSHGA